jgi:hypothetical protein
LVAGSQSHALRDAIRRRCQLHKLSLFSLLLHKFVKNKRV